MSDDSFGDNCDGDMRQRGRRTTRSMRKQTKEELKSLNQNADDDVLVEEISGSSHGQSSRSRSRQARQTAAQPNSGWITKSKNKVGIKQVTANAPISS